MMAYLRLDPHDYKTLSGLCHSLDLGRYSLPAFRRHLLLCLADLFPDLVTRVAALSRQQLQLLYQHFRARPRARRAHGLTAAEVEAVLSVGVPLMSQARFIRLLKRALVCRLAESHAALALKVDRLSLNQFEGLCEEVRGPGRKEV